MKAKKKPIQKLTPAELEVDLAPILETVKVSEPPKRVGGGKVWIASRSYGRILSDISIAAGRERGPTHRQAQGSRDYPRQVIAAVLFSLTGARRHPQACI